MGNKYGFLRNINKYQVEEIVLVATLKVPVATCGDKVGQRCFKVLPTDFEK